MSKLKKESWLHLFVRIRHRNYVLEYLVCPKCGGQMGIIAFIEDYKVIKKILDYLGIYKFRRGRPPPVVLSMADTFDDYKCDDYINTDYMDF